MWLVISDTHDNIPNVRAFLREALKRNVSCVFHCGDIISPFVLKEFLGTGIEFHGVFGNNDGEVLLLSERSSQRVKKGPRELEVEGFKILLMHEPVAIEALVSSQHYDYIFYGHTHMSEIRNNSSTMVINPGDASGYLAEASVVFVDPQRKLAELYKL